MTPLANLLLKQEVKYGPRDHWGTPVLDKLRLATCFECSQVLPLAMDLGRKMRAEGQFVGRLAFLPAPITWIEFIKQGQIVEESHAPPIVSAKVGSRVGLLLLADGEFNCHVQSVWWDLWGPPRMRPTATVYGDLLLNVDEPCIDLSPLCRVPEHRLEQMQAVAEADCANDPEDNKIDWERLKGAMEDGAEEFGFYLYALLAMINSPKMIRRVEHKPNSTLQKRLRSEMRDRSLELKPWHEIQLDVEVPPTANDNAQGDGHVVGERLTGPKAFHFCRSFLRVRLGKLERVRAHWRGDPALGIHRATYKVGARVTA